MQDYVLIRSFFPELFFYTKNFNLSLMGIWKKSRETEQTFISNILLVWAVKMTFNWTKRMYQYVDTNTFICPLRMFTWLRWIVGKYQNHAYSSYNYKNNLFCMVKHQIPVKTRSDKR